MLHHFSQTISRQYCANEFFCDVVDDYTMRFRWKWTFWREIVCKYICCEPLRLCNFHFLQVNIYRSDVKKSQCSESRTDLYKMFVKCPRAFCYLILFTLTCDMFTINSHVYYKCDMFIIISDMFTINFILRFIQQCRIFYTIKKIINICIIFMKQYKYLLYVYIIRIFCRA